MGNSSTNMTTTYAPGFGPTDPADIPDPKIGDTVRFYTWAGTSLVGIVDDISILTGTMIDGRLFSIESDGDFYDIRMIDIAHVVVAR